MCGVGSGWSPSTAPRRSAGSRFWWSPKKRSGHGIGRMLVEAAEEWMRKRAAG